MNTFDIAIAAFMIAGTILGFRAGLLRSLATILGYVAATPIALGLTSFVSPAIASDGQTAGHPNSLIFFIIFFMAGIGLSALLRVALEEAGGPTHGVVDRLAGAALGAIRIALVAVTIVLVFDRMVPPGREPAYLVGSHLRPLLSVAGEYGLKSLPPETTAFIDRFKARARS